MYSSPAASTPKLDGLAAAARELGGVLGQVGGRRLAGGRHDRQLDRPHAARDEVAEEVAPARGGAEQRAAIDVAAGDRLAG